MTIRELHESELGELIELYTHLKDEPLADDCDYERVFAEIKADPRHTILVAVEDNRIVASCVMVIIPNLTRQCHPYCLIENVVTHRDYRKRGFGTALLRFATDSARSQNCYKVMLLTGSKEQATLDFYKKAGFSSDQKTGFIIRF